MLNYAGEAGEGSRWLGPIVSRNCH